MSDLMAARMSYSTPLSYSIRLMAITNGNFSNETQREASQHGIRLLDRRELMSQLRSSSLTMGGIYTRESDRCKSFDEGIKAAKKWFDGLTSVLGPSIPCAHFRFVLVMPQVPL